MFQRPQSICYFYDSVNRVLGKQYLSTLNCSYGGGWNLSYAYDAGTYGIGRLTSMADASGSTTWSYDQLGHVIEIDPTVNGSVLPSGHSVPGKIKYSYYLNGSVKAVTYPSNRILNYQVEPGYGWPFFAFKVDPGTGQTLRYAQVAALSPVDKSFAPTLAVEALIEKRSIEVHLVKEARVIGKDSRSQDKFMHDIHVAVAKHYVENLKEEVKKGMREGVYPGRAPLGYRNNAATRSIDVDAQRAAVVRRIFELYVTGEYSLSTLRPAVIAETRATLSRVYLEQMLKSRFYLGYFV